MTELSKKLIRLVVDELRDEKKGALTIQGVIMALDEAARDLERSALRLHIEKCIDEVFSDQICQPQQTIAPVHIESKNAIANAAEAFENAMREVSEKVIQRYLDEKRQQ